MTTEVRETLTQWITRACLVMQVQRVPANPNLGAQEWKGASHWFCTIEDLSKPRSPDLHGPLFTTYFSQGSAFTPSRGPSWERSGPTIEDVLDCLASDAVTYDGVRDFEEWARDFGFDTDSRSAERTYRIIGEQTRALERFLGPSRYLQLLNVERL